MEFKIKEKHFDKSTYIGGWYIEKDVCEELIDYFNYNKKYATEGITFKGVNHDKKHSLDLPIGYATMDNIIGVYRKILQSILEKYLEKYPNAAQAEKFNIIQDYNLQYYDLNQGFKGWHYENSGGLNNYHRHLVFMTYLNDVEKGGTEFMDYPNVQDNAEQGLTLIWPAGWTHMHRGIVSNKSEKYIVTGWYNFEEIYKLGLNR